MDGIDLAYCEIKHEAGNWSYAIITAETIPYNEKWRIRLSQLRKQDALTFVKTDTFYGHYLGQLVNAFLEKHDLTVDFISSHGHTIFHQPDQGYTAQIGSGAALYAETGLPVVNDFRTVDVGYYGQGAPLVPVGDKLLFADYDYCLNLGGFANISLDHDQQRIAFDIAPCNIPLNRIARNLGQDYDEGGAIAATGSINYQLLEELNALPYYQEMGPKSLGREWINSTFWPVVRNYERNGVSQEDIMKTLADHIAGQIADAVEHYADGDAGSKRVLVTGGGAYNLTLIDHLRTHCEAQFIVPEETKLVDYKEALLFAFLGVLRIRGEENTWSSVTGAKKNSIGGAIWGTIN